MAVPEFLRNSRTMQVYVKARKILIHTRQIITSEKNIPKRHQRRFGDPLDQAVTENWWKAINPGVPMRGRGTQNQLSIKWIGCFA